MGEPGRSIDVPKARAPELQVFHEEMGTLQSYLLRMEEKCILENLWVAADVLSSW